MFCGMLEVNPKSDQTDNYFRMAKMLRPALEKIDDVLYDLPVLDLLLAGGPEIDPPE